jgi:hypothetical protein
LKQQDLNSVRSGLSEDNLWFVFEASSVMTDIAIEEAEIQAAAPAPNHSIGGAIEPIAAYPTHLGGVGLDHFDEGVYACAWLQTQSAHHLYPGQPVPPFQ